MPDHYRSQKGPRSSRSSESPLSLPSSSSYSPKSKDELVSSEGSSGYSSSDRLKEPIDLMIRILSQTEDLRSQGNSRVNLIKIKDFARCASSFSKESQNFETEETQEQHEQDEYNENEEEEKKIWSRVRPKASNNSPNFYNFETPKGLIAEPLSHNNSSFECKDCGKAFERASNLLAHSRTHIQRSLYVCSLCDKESRNSICFEEHVRSHSGDKPFVCLICSKAYARKSHLNVHYRVHTGERPFVCLLCSKDFTEKRFLNDHNQTAHSGKFQGPLRCPNCYREFAYKTSLKQHLKKQMCVKNLIRNSGVVVGAQCTPSSWSIGGNNSKQFSCPFCDKSYSWKQTLKQHVSMYHRNKVHTDEFWKYELAKHRKGLLDSRANEDLWRQQLGRHVENEDETDFPNYTNKCSPLFSEENKALALLGSRRHEVTKDERSQMKNLSLLASISCGVEPLSSLPLRIKEESSTKRTQMWLAQLGVYRIRHLSEDTSRNHEELWEEQIAKIKTCPVRSPLEPEEITIEDDDEGETQDLLPNQNPKEIIEEEEGEEEGRGGGCKEMKTSPVHLESVQTESSPGMVPYLSALSVSAGLSEEDVKSSVLKSLLLEGVSRKRSSPESLTTFHTDEILRRRLLGEDSKDFEYKFSSLSSSTSSSSSTSTSNDLNFKSPKKYSDNLSSYAHTSVLKSLLHRYTESHQM